MLAVKIDGAAKEDYVWGLHVGFISFTCKGMTSFQSDAMENHTAEIARAFVSSVPKLSPSLLLKAYSALGYKGKMQREFQLIKNRYREYFEPLNSGYFMCFLLKDAEGEDIRQILLE